MNKKVQLFLIAGILVIAAIVLYDSLSTRVHKRPDNPFQFSVDEFKKVDHSLVSYQELRQIAVNDPKAFTTAKGKIYLTSGNQLQVITPQGQELLAFAIEPNATSMITDAAGNILIAYEHYVVKYDANGIELQRSETFNDKSLLVSLAMAENMIFITDAGKRRVLVFDSQLQFINSFKGESGVSDMHGFIVPSLHFALAVNLENELWIVNPGLHSMQNYSLSGRLRRYWAKSSFDLDGFSGCCNPYYIAFLSDGRFVTSEKGLVRVKIHHESGAFESVVATPDQFPGAVKAPAIAVDENDGIWLLDFEQSLLRYFEPKANTPIS